MKIGVVGCGFVGSASAYACLMQGVGREIILVDHFEKLAKAQAQDIMHAAPFSHPIKIKAGSYEDLAGSSVVMIAAGVNQKPGETRLDLLKRNADIFATIIPEILKYAGEAVLVVATNPVDIMTQITIDIAHKTHNYPAERIIGSGTILDTARFRALLGQHLNVSSHSVHANVLGEHGDSEVLHWSGARIGTISLEDFAAQSKALVTESIKKQIDHAVRHAAYSIIEGKGATWYGIGAGMAKIARAIIDDEHAMITCSSSLHAYEDLPQTAFSLPRIICANGIEDTLHPHLSTEETADLRQSAEILKSSYDEILAS